MLHHTHTILIAAACTLPMAMPLSAQVWNEVGAGNIPTEAETTLGSGVLTQIHGSIDGTEGTDLFIIHVDDPATFACSTVGGAGWDTQLWMFDLQGNGISFRDNDPGTQRSTLTGQFLAGPGPVIIGISTPGRDALDAGGQELWLDAPLIVERQPDGPGASNALTQWSPAIVLPFPTYTINLAGASFAGEVRPEQAAVAWAWVDPIGAGASFTPQLSYQHNPTGELITVERTAQGRFVVDMGELPNTGVPHVTAFGGNHAAVIERWLVSNGSLKLQVNVFNQNGSLLDAGFCVHYRVGGGDTERGAYLWANDATSPGYTPTSTFYFNGNRGSATISRIGTGDYQVTLPGLGEVGASERGSVQATAYSGAGVVSLLRARVSGWFTSGNDLRVTVRTLNAAGVPADARFTMSYQQVAAPIPSHQGSGAHVWANDASAASYAPSAAYTDSNGTAGPADSETIDRLGVGYYAVHLPNLIPQGSSIAMATTHGLTAAYASIAGWGGDLPTGTRVRVRTYDTNGSPVDARFTLLYLTNDPAGTPASNSVIGSGCGGLSLNANTRPVLDSDWEVSLLDVPPTTVVGVVALGVANPNVPLGSLGAPGCWLYNDLLVITAVPLLSGAPALSLHVPNSAGLVGYSFLAQGAVLATGINALDVVTSNGVRAVVGDV